MFQRKLDLDKKVLRMEVRVILNSGEHEVLIVEDQVMLIGNKGCQSI